MITRYNISKRLYQNKIYQKRLYRSRLAWAGGESTPSSASANSTSSAARRRTEISRTTDNLFSDCVGDDNKVKKQTEKTNQSYRYLSARLLDELANRCVVVDRTRPRLHAAQQSNEHIYFTQQWLCILFPYNTNENNVETMWMTSLCVRWRRQHGHWRVHRYSTGRHS